MEENLRPKDRVIAKKEKPPARVINMKLDLELVAAIEEMARSNMLNGLIPAPRKFHNMIDCALKYAVWKWSHGEGPDKEMERIPRGYTQWNENLRPKPRVQ